jgi:hypothetical protein
MRDGAAAAALGLKTKQWRRRTDAGVASEQRQSGV